MHGRRKTILPCFCVFVPLVVEEVGISIIALGVGHLVPKGTHETSKLRRLVSEAQRRGPTQSEPCPAP